MLREVISSDGTAGRGEEKKKWALVAWDKIYKPKSHGGLGLHDPQILNKVLGEKLWWKCDLNLKLLEICLQGIQFRIKHV